MLQEIISYIPSIAILLVLMTFVVINNPGKDQNRAFVFLASSIACWLTALFIADTSSSAVIALNSLRTGIVFTNFIMFSLAYFVLTFPYNESVDWKKILYLAALPATLSVFAYSNLMIENVSVGGAAAQIETSGPLYLVQVISLALYGVFSFVLLLRKAKKATIIQRAQVKLIVMSGVLAVILNLSVNSTFITVGLDQYTTLINGLSIVIVSAALTYAIVRHRMFDIRFVVARTIAYALLILTMGLIYGFIVFNFVDGFFPESQITIPQKTMYTLLAVFLAFTFQPIKRFFDKLTDRFFYRDRYDTEDVLNRLGKIFVANSNSFELLDASLKIISETLKVEFGRLLVADKVNIYKAAHIGAHEDAVIDIRDLDELEKPISVVDELTEAEKTKVPISVGAYALVKLETQDSSVGYLVLGAKRSGTVFTKQDINFLEILSQELAVAIQNAKSYEEIQAFSETLKREVEDATAKLRDTNKRLVKLDEAKDEFISMASHQLRTPLTAIKGYLSMLLDGDAGKLAKKQKDFIDMAFVSSQRMVHLISDMLNVSRISTGRLTIDKAKFDLVAVVESELSQLHRQIEAHEVKLEFEKPNEPVEIALDENKIRQVIMNFTDNAMYYSPKGNVEVSVKEEAGVVEFRVKDNGIGVSEEAKKQLFTKFFRAENAQAVRPDGTGLGLYMAKQVIEAQGGEIIFSSEKGKGSIFGFRFRLEDEQKNHEDDRTE